MEARAKARYVRISPQKAKWVGDVIKGKPVEQALNMLKFMPQKGSVIIEKVVRSAIANAEHNLKMDIDALYVKNVTADQGPTLKRFRARARGRGARILKRMSHITVVLTEKTV